ncbi:MAG: hypothetical protein VXW43_03695 [Pseudomonadota bacterium]|nr:hypothetical protein [Pseudomonadota bacterium]
MTSSKYDPVCPDEFGDLPAMVHGMLEYCEYAEHIMAIGAVLRFVEDFAHSENSHRSAYVVGFGSDLEREDIVQVVTVALHGDTMTLGRGEHFKPGPRIDDPNIAYDRFDITRGEPVDVHRVDRWVETAQTVLEGAQKIDGSY